PVFRRSSATISPLTIRYYHKYLARYLSSACYLCYGNEQPSMSHDHGNTPTRGLRSDPRLGQRDCRRTSARTFAAGGEPPVAGSRTGTRLHALHTHASAGHPD